MPSNYDAEFLTQYYELLWSIHRQLQPRFYLEVGVRNGDSLSQAGIETKCIGIDPAFDITAPLSPYTKLFRCKSEALFKTNELSALLSGNPIDLAFIDGLHLFESTLMDFINIEKHCDRDSVVIVHDTLPLDEVTAARERATQIWSGDVWKLLLILQRFRPDLLVKNVSVTPTGLSVIGNLDSRSKVLEKGYERICSEYLDLPYSEYEILRRRLSLSYYSKAETQSLFAEFTQAGFSAFRGPQQPVCSRTHLTISQQSLGPLSPRSTLTTRSVRPSSTAKCLGVLLCYNDADILADVLSYMLEQNHDMIVWDHSSDDETSSILDQFDGEMVERRLIPRDFDFYYLYQSMSKNLIDNYLTEYDWISWPDQDEILEGPARKRSYYDYLQELFQSQCDWIRFNNFNYWFTPQDSSAESSPVRRIRYYSLFPDCAPRIRSWRASATNIRVFNHNDPLGIQHRVLFNLRHYPMRSVEQARKRILRDRANLQRGNHNVHYENMAARPFDSLILSPEQLHFDDGIGELNPDIKFDWKSIYYGRDRSSQLR